MFAWCLCYDLDFLLMLYYVSVALRHPLETT